MKRYVSFLKNGLVEKGHNVEVWFPKPYFSNKNLPFKFNKWLRYIDQFILFPIVLLFRTQRLSKDTLYVLIDQALGMWMPILKNKYHIVHCHDFTALKSSIGQIAQNPTGRTGKIYQKLILKGVSQAQNFISVSKRTQQELVTFLKRSPTINNQIYNAIDPIFSLGNIDVARKEVGMSLGENFDKGYILHVGGNDFYKNRVGVILLYTEWRKQTKKDFPLIMVGYEPNQEIYRAYDSSSFKEDIYFFKNISNDMLVKCYRGALLFLFPSLYEGFGWPVAEAMACGCPVITTDDAPMNEVGGDAAWYISNSVNYGDLTVWAKTEAKAIDSLLNLDESDREGYIFKSKENAKRFTGKVILDEIEKTYLEVLDSVQD
ncbi:glycosyltransferase family 4 protein [Euzebyella marina]|nr:glycosyltransferase family 1 protein [Euzebyella marina]